MPTRFPVHAALAAAFAGAPAYAQPTSASTPVETLAPVTVQSSADASATGLLPVYPGGQVARGGRLGLGAAGGEGGRTDLEGGRRRPRLGAIDGEGVSVLAGIRGAAARAGEREQAEQEREVAHAAQPSTDSSCQPNASLCRSC